MNLSGIQAELIVAFKERLAAAGRGSRQDRRNRSPPAPCVREMKQGMRRGEDVHGKRAMVQRIHPSRSRREWRECPGQSIARECSTAVAGFHAMTASRSNTTIIRLTFVPATASFALGREHRGQKTAGPRSTPPRPGHASANAGLTTPAGEGGQGRRHEPSLRGIRHRADGE